MRQPSPANESLAVALPREAAGSSEMLFGTRDRRVLVLLAAVAVLSVADLVMTLGFMQSVGMFEDNPLVHLLLRLAGSARTEVLVGYKTATVAFAIAVLYRLRHRVQGEVGTWLAVVLVGSVCVQWVRYADVVLELDHSALQCVAQADERWVLLQ